MENIKYRALVAFESGDGYESEIRELNTADLPAGEVLVRVSYSALNYKDALSANGNKGVTRNFPHTPGIDASGVVAASESDDFSIGDEVFITGYDFGMNTSGGFGGYVRVPAAWVMKLPKGLSPKDVMILGTAGLTAAMCVDKMSASVKPGDGLIAVSGASGGVGSLSLSILAAAGYRAAAVTGKPDEDGFFSDLGVSEIISRAELEEESGRPMLKARFAGGIDTLGGVVLQNMLKSTAPLGAVSCCGNAASGDLALTVYPFILRGVSLIGIDSQNCPADYRRYIWNRLASDWKPGKLLEMYEEVGLESLPAKISSMIAGRTKGRILIRHEV